MAPYGTTGTRANSSSNGDLATSGTLAGKFSLSLGGASRKHASGSRQYTAGKPARASLLGDSLEADTDGQQHEKISTFGGRLPGTDSGSTSQVSNDRVVKAIPNKDWREESRRKRRKYSNDDVGGRTGATSQATTGEKIGQETERAENETIPKFGLNVVHQSKKDVNGSDVEHALNTDADQPQPASSRAATVPQTADEEALSALLGHHQPSNKAIIAPAPLSEEEAFRDSYVSAPRNCTLEEYEATPVEGYGAAILRGYLKQGQTLDDHISSREGSKKNSGAAPERRPGLLGLGAKESGLGVELGAWGKSAGTGRGKGSGPAEATYNPLARRNKKTGQLVSDEQADRRLESQNVSSRHLNKYNEKDGLVISSESRFNQGGRLEERRDYDEDRERRRRQERRIYADNGYDYERRRRENDTDGLDRRRAKDKYRDRGDRDRKRDRDHQSRRRENDTDTGSSRREKSYGQEIATNGHSGRR